ncbi:MAG: hypothetical protein J6S76_01485 [Clostridia bacterium]|nr:hypothetical protein [Clostridia bacterium]
MDQSADRRNHKTNSRTASASELHKLFLSGMRTYALCAPAQLRSITVLCALMLACAISGAVACLYASGDTAFDAAAAVRAYCDARDPAQYRTAAEYLSFFSAWFFHTALSSAPALLCMLSVIPALPAAVLCAVRGFLSGYVLTLLRGAPGAALPCAVLIQLLLAAQAVCLSAKCLRFGRRRAEPNPAYRAAPLRYAIAEIAPILTFTVLLYTAQAAVQLSISVLLLI